MNKNGCFNRAPLCTGAIVQAGWDYYNLNSRKPVMILIDDPLSKHCQYSRDKKDDPKCEGCRWKE